MMKTVLFFAFILFANLYVVLGDCDCTTNPIQIYLSAGGSRGDETFFLNPIPIGADVLSLYNFQNNNADWAAITALVPGKTPASYGESAVLTFVHDDACNLFLILGNPNGGKEEFFTANSFKINHLPPIHLLENDSGNDPINEVNQIGDSSYTIRLPSGTNGDTDGIIFGPFENGFFMTGEKLPTDTSRYLGLMYIAGKINGAVTSRRIRAVFGEKGSGVAFQIISRPVCGCQDGQFGSPCEDCECSVAGSVDGNCNENGACECNEGFTGAKCDQCVAGRYGGDCHACECHLTGSVSENCDNNGECTCKPGFTGPKCDQCESGHFGFPNCDNCGCNTVGSVNGTCNAEGKCECKPGFEGPKCNQCAVNYYQNVRHGACKDCKCHPEGSESLQCRNCGGCDCKATWRGSKCNINCPRRCAIPSQKIKRCDQFKRCNFNCERDHSNRIRKCNKKENDSKRKCNFARSQKIKKCKSQFSRHRNNCRAQAKRNKRFDLQRCLDRAEASKTRCISGAERFGTTCLAKTNAAQVRCASDSQRKIPLCKNNCARTKDNFDFNTCKPNKWDMVCDSETKECDTCVKGYYGKLCDKRCSRHCKSGCDRETGVCIDCQKNRWGDRCENSCHRGCAAVGKRVRRCDRDNGSCFKCQLNYWGPNCANKCDSKCRAGRNCRKCDSRSGKCAQCAQNRWGDNCENTCDKGCKGNAFRKCSRTNGRCAGAKDKIPKCGRFNFNDERACSGQGNCIRFGSRATCRCNPGFSGNNCERKLRCNGINFDDDRVCGGNGHCTVRGCVCDKIRRFFKGKLIGRRLNNNCEAI